MKRIAIALVALSGVASAQGTPFSYTVPFPDITRLQAILHSSAGYGDALGLNQFAELDLPIGPSFVLTATSGVAFHATGAPLQSVGQIEAMVDAVRFAGWHFAVSGGVRRDYNADDYGFGRLGLSRSTETWSVAANVDVVRSLSGGPSLPNWSQTFASFGATKNIASFVSLGGETMLSEARSTFVYFGPVASFALPGGHARLDLSGGPNICTAGNCGIPQNYSLVERFGAPFPAHQSGYTLRLAVRVGL